LGRAGGSGHERLSSIPAEGGYGHDHSKGLCRTGWRRKAVERIWHYLRSHWLANWVFTSLADIMDACETAWNRFATNHGLPKRADE
jgi:hypothetical protein